MKWPFNKIICLKIIFIMKKIPSFITNKIKDYFTLIIKGTQNFMN